MELTNEPFEDILEKLKNPTGSQRRDPRSIRRAAVTSAIVDSIDAVSASKVYARAVTALEGTLTSTNVNIDAIGTQISILELLSLTVPHVELRTMLNATLPLTSRVLRGVVSTDGLESTIETKDELGGMNALLRWTCKATTAILSHLSSKSLDETEVKQFLRGTLLALFEDRRPKVRRAAHAGVLEMLTSTTRTPKLVALTSSFVHAELKNSLLAVANEDSDSFKSLSHLLAFLTRSIQHLNYPLLFSDVMEIFALLMKNQQSSISSTDFVVAPRKVREASPKLMIVSSILAIGLNLLGDEDQGREAKVDEIASRVLASLLQTKPSLVFVSAEQSLLQNVKMQHGQLIIAACNRLLSEAHLEVVSKLLPLSVQMLMNLCIPDEDGDPDVAQSLLVELTQVFRMKLPLLEQHPTCLTSMMQSMQVLVTDPAYRPTWSVSLKCYVVMAAFVPTMHDSVLGSLLQIRTESKKGSQFAVEDALSTLVQTIGTEKVWNSMRWNTQSDSGGVARDRVWVLTNMKNAANIAQPVRPRLEFFRTNVLSLARKCDELAATQPGADKNFHRGCVISAWALFPGFCHDPSDIESEILPLSDTLCRALGDKRYPDLLPTICSGLIRIATAFEEKGGLELEDALEEKQNFAAASQTLLPTLFKFVTDTHAAVSDERKNSTKQMDIEGEDKQGGNAVEGFQKLKCVTEAISVLARLAERSFLEGLFKTVMQRLLEEIQTESGDSERICALLTLSQALVSSQVLTEDSLNFLYRALKPLIRNDETTPRVQKRAYKVLYELCERHSSFVTAEERLKELTLLLTGTIMTSQISARHMRLKCMSSIVRGLDATDESKMANLNEVVPEVLLCLKDFNAKTREAAYSLLLSMAEQGNLLTFVNVILAALGAKTSHMRSAVVLALSRLVFEHARENDELKALLPRLLQTILVLVNEASREVLKSVVGFVRICVSAIPPVQLEPLVPELLGALLDSQQAKSRFRSKIKIILKKLVKLFGYDALMQSVPASETRLLTHMRKLDEREKRKRLSARSDAESRMVDFEHMVESDEEDSDDGMTFVTGATGLLSRKSRQPLPDAKSLSSKRSKRSEFTARATSGLRLPDQDNGEVVDMLGSSMAKRVHFAEESSDDDSDGALEFDDDGRIVVYDDDDQLKSEDMDVSRDAGLETLKKKRSPHQQKHTNNDNTKKTKLGLGSSYQSRKAGGDVKRKGQKFEPYAYVPLDGRDFSKKNRRNAVDQMSTVVRGKGSRKRK